MPVETGKWYLSVNCRNPHCGRGIAFAECEPPPAGIPLPDTIPARCPACGQNGVWSPEEVIRSQGKKMH